MADLDPAVVTAKVAAALNVTTPGDVDDAVAAAIVYVRTYTGYDEAALELPDDKLTVEGLVILAERIFLDQFAPNGAQSALGDTTFVPLFTPEDLAAHNHHYWDRLTVSWGIG